MIKTVETKQDRNYKALVKTMTDYMKTISQERANKHHFAGNFHLLSSLIFLFLVY